MADEMLKGKQLAGQGSFARMDTTLSLKELRDTLKNLTDTEKKILENGSMRVRVNKDEEMFQIILSFPFSHSTDITSIRKLLEKRKPAIISRKMIDLAPRDKLSPEQLAMINEIPPDDQGADDLDMNLDKYYDFKYEKNKISRSLIREKFAEAKNDSALQSVMDMSKFSFPAKLKTIINLPGPAKKITGKNIIVSDDRKQILIKGTLNDFFEDPSKFEYEIDY